MCAPACRPLLPPFAVVSVLVWVGEGEVPGKGWGKRDNESASVVGGVSAWKSIWVQKQGRESRDAEH